jgi:hypothetical protein
MQRPQIATLAPALLVHGLLLLFVIAERRVAKRRKVTLMTAACTREASRRVTKA